MITPAQLEILRLARTMSNAAIAANLTLAVQTVKNQLRRAFMALGVSSRTDALCALDKAFPNWARDSSALAIIAPRRLSSVELATIASHRARCGTLVKRDREALLRHIVALREASARQHSAKSDADSPLRIRLTRDQLRVLRIAESQSDQQIADLLGMSIRQVQSRLAYAYRSLSAFSRASACRRLDEGWPGWRREPIDLLMVKPAVLENRDIEAIAQRASEPHSSQAAADRRSLLGHIAAERLAKRVS
jgi:DNA-binding NarL/FixJ family response regulator